MLLSSIEITLKCELRWASFIGDRGVRITIALARITHLEVGRHIECRYSEEEYKDEIRDPKSTILGKGGSQWGLIAASVLQLG
jgi:hypothetical protein